MFKPSSNKFKVMACINPAAVRMKDGLILLYVRVMENLARNSDKNFSYSPRFSGKERFEIVVDRFEKEKISDESDVDILFKDGTKRLKFISHFRRVYLNKDGITIRKIEQKPAFFGTSKDSDLGVEDPRIVKIGRKYYMTYVSLSRTGNVSTNYATSDDSVSWKRGGIMFAEQNKDVVLFPEKIKDEYYSLNRPEGSVYSSCN